jgi:hypothetical protein
MSVREDTRTIGTLRLMESVLCHIFTFGVTRFRLLCREGPGGAVRSSEARFPADSYL